MNHLVITQTSFNIPAFRLSSVGGHYSAIISFMTLAKVTNLLLLLTLVSLIFFLVRPSAPHQGCLSNEQDIPEEARSSEQQLNSGAGGNYGALLTRLMCKF